MLIKMKSMFTGKVNEMDLPVTQADIDAWRASDRVIQSVFPDLTDDQREFLMTGATPQEWDDLFGEEE